MLLHVKDKLSENFWSYSSFFQGMLYISGALKIFLNIFRHKFTLFEGLVQDKMQKFTNTWIIESLVYFSHGKTYYLKEKLKLSSKFKAT